MEEAYKTKGKGWITSRRYWEDTITVKITLFVLVCSLGPEQDETTQSISILSYWPGKVSFEHSFSSFRSVASRHHLVNAEQNEVKKRNINPS